MNKFISMIFGILACMALLAPNAQARPQFGIPIPTGLVSLASVPTSTSTGSNPITSVISGGTDLASNSASSLTSAASSATGVVGSLASVVSGLNPLSGTGTNNTDIVSVGMQTAHDMNTGVQNMATAGITAGLDIFNSFNDMFASWGLFGLKTAAKVTANQVANAIPVV